MKSFAKILTGSLLVLSVIEGSAQQSNTSNVLDGIYVKEHTPERKVVPYTYLREADVMWAKRIWRVIDMREKINHPLYFPREKVQGRESLMQVLYRGVLEDGTLTAYEDEEFKVPRTKQEISAMLSKVDTLQIEDPDNPGTYVQKIVPQEFYAGSVKKFKIKEDWFFDKQKSVLEVRIVGIAAVQEVPKGDVMFDKTLFWIYFPEARYVFANAEVYNRQNDAERRTFEDVFWKRTFGSYVYKEQNVYDRLINEYATNMDALLESERIKDEIFTFEHDLWEY